MRLDAALDEQRDRAARRELRADDGRRARLLEDRRHVGVRAVERPLQEAGDEDLAEKPDQGVRLAARAGRSRTRRTPGARPPAATEQTTQRFARASAAYHSMIGWPSWPRERAEALEQLRRAVEVAGLDRRVGAEERGVAGEQRARRSRPPGATPRAGRRCGRRRCAGSTSRASAASARARACAGRRPAAPSRAPRRRAVARRRQSGSAMSSTASCASRRRVSRQSSSPRPSSAASQHGDALAVDALRGARRAAVVRHRGPREPVDVAELAREPRALEQRLAVGRVAGHALGLAAGDRRGRSAAQATAPRRSSRSSAWP